MAWQDTFTRSNQSGWGTASDGETWSHPIGTATLSIASNKGVVTGQSARQIMLLGSQSALNCQGIVRVACDATTDLGTGVGLRANSAGTNGYYGFILPTSVIIGIGKISGGASTTLASTSFTTSANTFYWLLFQANGSTLSFKVWQDGTAQPGAWSLTTTDTTFPSAGQFGLRTFPGGAGNTTKFDNFQVNQISQQIVGNHKAVGRFT